IRYAKQPSILIEAQSKYARKTNRTLQGRRAASRIDRIQGIPVCRSEYQRGVAEQPVSDRIQSDANDRTGAIQLCRHGGGSGMRIDRQQLVGVRVDAPQRAGLRSLVRSAISAKLVGPIEVNLPPD